MAEIKSTMEMVMERAARIAATADIQGGDDEERRKEGMRAAAAFMGGEESDLMSVVTAAGEEGRAVLQGMVSVFLRNIILPRAEEQKETAERAMAGLLNLAGNNAELLSFFGEMKKMLDQYHDHRQQLRTQLEENFRQQVEQLEGTLARQTGMAMKVQPSQHPKFQEEWQRILDQLNGQYGQALEDQKAMIARFLGVE